MGFVLERLIGAMTVQQKMDSLKGSKEEVSKIDEDQHSEIHKTVQEVLSISYFIISSYKKKKKSYKAIFNLFVFP